MGIGSHSWASTHLSLWHHLSPSILPLPSLLWRGRLRAGCLHRASGNGSLPSLITSLLVHIHQEGCQQHLSDSITQPVHQDSPLPEDHSWHHLDTQQFTDFILKAQWLSFLLIAQGYNCIYFPNPLLLQLSTGVCILDKLGSVQLLVLKYTVVNIYTNCCHTIWLSNKVWLLVLAK